MSKKYQSLPYKSSKRYCDELWSKIVKIRDGNRCIICLKENSEEEKSINNIRDNGRNLINSHHLITRRVTKYRWDIDNGISLCPKHHHYDFEISAHTAPWGIEEWLKSQRISQYEKWVENRRNIETVKNPNYDQIYYNLEREYKNITGEYYRSERILIYELYSKKIDIQNDYKNTNMNLNEIAKKYGVSYKAITMFVNDTNIKIKGKQKHKKIIGRTHKVCPQCHTDKPISEYHKAIDSSDGHHGFCKECRKKTTKSYYKTNNDKIKEQNKENYFEKKARENN